MKNVHALALRPTGMLLVVVLALGATSPAATQEKKYGYDSRVGGGSGAKFSSAESTKIVGALDKMADVTTKVGTYKAEDIRKALKKMLEDGRMGKGVGANAGTYATTLGDGKASTDGDKMNIADHHIKDGDNKNLANTLAHEWLHCTQGDMTEAEAEAPAYQLGRQIYIDKGGAAADAPATSDQTQIDNFKKIIEAAKVVVPDSKAPAKGADKKRSVCGHEYYLNQDPGRIYLWSSVSGYRDSVLAGPNRMYFSFLNYHTPPNCDRLVVFGTDRTSPSNPQGFMTVVDANAFGFFARQDLPLPGLRYPFSVSQDSASLTIYVLDAHVGGPGIARMMDLNADRIPDNILPYAPRGFPGVDSAEAVVWTHAEDIGPGLALDPMDRRGDSSVLPFEPITLLRDLDSNGQADIAIELVELNLASFPPHFTARPLPDDLQVEVQAMPGHQIQIVVTDASGDANFGSIGGATAPPTGLPFAIGLFAPLLDQQYIKAVDITDDTQGPAPTQVTTALPGANPALLAGLAALLASAGMAAARRRRSRLND